jgi:hypothetical protein
MTAIVLNVCFALLWIVFFAGLIGLPVDTWRKEP